MQAHPYFVGAHIEAEGGYFAGLINLHGAPRGVIVAPKASGEFQGIWLPGYDAVPDACSCFDSLANTRAMASAGSEMAKQALELNIAGHNDWAIPARDVLELMYRNLKPSTRKNICSFRDGDNGSSLPVGYPYTEDSPAQTSTEAFRVGNEQAFNESWYWSSTQSSDDYAYLQGFNGGTQDDSSKSAKAWCRAVRLIHIEL